MGPIDYMSLMPKEDFLGNVMGGLEAGSAIRQNDMKMQQQQIALDRAKSYQSDIGTAMTNPTPQAFTALALKYPEHREAFKQGWDTLNQDQQQSELRDGAAIAASLHSDRPDLATQQVQARIIASKNSGQPTKPYEDLLQLIQTDPNQAYAHTLGVLSGIPGGDKILTGLGTIGANRRADNLAPAEVRKATADAGAAESGATIKAVEAANAPTKTALENGTALLGNKNVQSQITDRAARLALDQDRLTSEVQDKLDERQAKYGTLPEYVAKQSDEATLASVGADQSATQMIALASKIDAAGLSGGSGAKVSEWWKKTFGNQDDLTRIRGEYNRIVTPSAMAAYKKVAAGSTSDKDIETAMTGVPSDTASPETMASFLRGAAKLQVYESTLNGAKSEWWGEVKHLGKAKGDMEIMGVQVPAGTTFRQFVDKGMLNAAINEKLQAKNAEQVPTRSYMRHATPGAQ